MPFLLLGLENLHWTVKAQCRSLSDKKHCPTILCLQFSSLSSLCYNSFILLKWNWDSLLYASTMVLENSNVFRHGLYTLVCHRPHPCPIAWLLVPQLLALTRKAFELWPPAGGLPAVDSEFFERVCLKMYLYIRPGSPEKQNSHDGHIKRFITRNWLTLLWGMISPKTYCQQTRDPGEPIAWFQSECWQAWDPGRASVSVQVWRQGGRKQCPISKTFRRRTPLIHGRDIHFVLFSLSTD